MPSDNDSTLDLGIEKADPAENRMLETHLRKGGIHKTPVYLSFFFVFWICPLIDYTCKLLHHHIYVVNGYTTVFV